MKYENRSIFGLSGGEKNRAWHTFFFVSYVLYCSPYQTRVVYSSRCQSECGLFLADEGQTQHGGPGEIISPVRRGVKESDDFFMRVPSSFIWQMCSRGAYSVYGLESGVGGKLWCGCSISFDPPSRAPPPLPRILFPPQPKRDGGKAIGMVQLFLPCFLFFGGER